MYTSLHTFSVSCVLVMKGAAVTNLAVGGLPGCSGQFLSEISRVDISEQLKLGEAPLPLQRHLNCTSPWWATLMRSEIRSIQSESQPRPWILTIDKLYLIFTSSNEIRDVLRLYKDYKDG